MNKHDWLAGAEILIEQFNRTTLEGLKKVFNVGMLTHPVSEATLEWARSLAFTASPKATLECAHSFGKVDFREDLKATRVPTLVIHGESDQTVPIDASGARTAKLIAGAQYKTYSNGPHGLFITHKDQLNLDLKEFVQGS